MTNQDDPPSSRRGRYRQKRADSSSAPATPAPEPLVLPAEDDDLPEIRDLDRKDDLAALLRSLREADPPEAVEEIEEERSNRDPEEARPAPPQPPPAPSNAEPEFRPEEEDEEERGDDFSLLLRSLQDSTPTTAPSPAARSAADRSGATWKVGASEETNAKQEEEVLAELLRAIGEDVAREAGRPAGNGNRPPLGGLSAGAAMSGPILEVRADEVDLASMADDLDDPAPGPRNPAADFDDEEQDEDEPRSGRGWKIALVLAAAGLAGLGLALFSPVSPPPAPPVVSVAVVPPAPVLPSKPSMPLPVEMPAAPQPRIEPKPAPMASPALAPPVTVVPPLPEIPPPPPMPLKAETPPDPAPVSIPAPPPLPPPVPAVLPVVPPVAPSLPPMPAAAAPSAPVPLPPVPTSRAVVLPLPEAPVPLVAPAPLALAPVAPPPVAPPPVAPPSAALPPALPPMLAPPPPVAPPPLAPPPVAASPAPAAPIATETPAPARGLALAVESGTTARPATEDEPPGPYFTVQMGSFQVVDNANRLIGKLRDEGFDAFLKEWVDASGRTWHVVRVGRLESRDEVQELAASLAGRNGSGAEIIRVGRRASPR